MPLSIYIHYYQVTHSATCWSAIIVGFRNLLEKKLRMSVITVRKQGTYVSSTLRETVCKNIDDHDVGF